MKIYFNLLILNIIPDLELFICYKEFSGGIDFEDR